MKKPYYFFLFLTLATSMVIFLPTLNFQSLLSQGDHGQNLYAFKKVCDGALPYKDFWWEYGPLMPYYYAAFYKLFGISIQSVLFGKFALSVVLSLLFFLASATLAGPFFSFVAAVWFSVFNPDFFYTYNHIGGSCMLLGVILSLLCYLKNPARLYLLLSMGSIFLLSLIKLNMGIAAFFSWGAFLLLYGKITQNPLVPRHRRDVYFFSAFLLPLIFLSYGFFLFGLPPYIIRQSLPQFSPFYLSTVFIWDNIPNLLRYFFGLATVSWANFFITAIIVFSAARVLFAVIRKDPAYSKSYLWAVVMLCIYSIATLHEFLVSGVLYRGSWAFPALILLMFALLTKGVSGLPRLMQYLLFCLLLFLCLQTISERNTLIRRIESPDHFLSLKRGQVYVNNSDNWIKTVQQTTDYLDSALGKNQDFLALPYDPLYYFLSDKNSPTRVLSFLEYVHILPVQEREIIDTLESKHIDYILMSNRIETGEPGLGVFGKTYCPLLAQYIAGNFKEVASFGDWYNEPGWAWNHGTKILKRLRP